METVERNGEVIGFAHGQAQVRLERASGCSGCGSRGTCASGSAATQVIQMPVPEKTRIGDQITVSMPSSSVALAAMLGYLLPPAVLLIGAIVAATYFGSDLAAVFGAGVGFIAGLLLARLIAGLAFGQGLAPSVCDHGLHHDFQPGEHS